MTDNVCSPQLHPASKYSTINGHMIGTVVVITNDGEIYPTINLLDELWPNQKWQMYGGNDYPTHKIVKNQGWEDWNPKQGMVGCVVWVWDESSNPKSWETKKNYCFVAN